MDFAAARRMMVDGQIRPADVTDPRLIDAMIDVPRETFLPPESAALAYLDREMPIPSAGRDRSMLQPRLLARMIHALALTGTETVLDVGCLSGYSAAVLARLVARVTALEETPAAARQAQDNLVRAGAANVTCVAGPLADGWQAAAPYDAIIVEGAAEVEPPAKLSGQLGPGGRLIVVCGRGASAKATIYYSSGGAASGRPVFDAAAPLLPGFAKQPAFVF